MPTPSGGNVKELCCAASQPGGGDLDVVRYHLGTGADPNFQHPEFMTTPLLEAIRAGNHEAVKILLEHKQSADPTIPGDWEGQTPLELAIELKSHAMVDLLLPFLPEDYVKECKTVLVTGTFQRGMLAHFLDLGHCVIVVADEEAVLNKEAEKLRKDTGNKKLWVLLQSNLDEFLRSPSKDAGVWTPSKVDVWLHKVTKPEELVCEYASLYPDGKDASKILLLVESSAYRKRPIQEQLSWLLAQESVLESNVFALVEPASWWDATTYSFWYRTWCTSMARLLGLVQVSLEDPHVAKDRGVPGKAYNYKRKTILLPSRDGIDASLVDEWSRQLEAL